MKTSEFLEIVEKEGFKQALKVDFKGYEGRDEAIYIFWEEKKGILLCFDTYGINVNGGHFYYNWVPKDREVAYKYTHTGGFEKHNNGMVWVGSHDCRIDMDKNIKNLEENGDFVVPWINRPFLWLLHYKDEERENILVDKKYKLVNERRIALLPREIQDAIRGK